MLKLGYFTHGHDLLKLFEEMPYEMQQSINVVYQALVPNGQIKDVLTKLKSDFEDWRYLYELKDGTSVNSLDLLVATEAMISNFDAISSDQKSPLDIRPKSPDFAEDVQGIGHARGNRHRGARAHFRSPQSIHRLAFWLPDDWSCCPF